MQPSRSTSVLSCILPTGHFPTPYLASSHPSPDGGVGFAFVCNRYRDNDSRADPGTNNIFSTSHSVLALPCQPTSHRRNGDCLPPADTHHYNQMASPAPLARTANRLVWTGSRLFHLCPRYKSHLKHLPCANVLWDYLELNQRQNSGHKLVCFCAVCCVLCVGLHWD